MYTVQHFKIIFIQHTYKNFLNMGAEMFFEPLDVDSELTWLFAREGYIIDTCT
jgi:hypothetical protein